MRIVLAMGALRAPISGASETVVTYASHLRRSGHDASLLLIYPPQRDDPYLRRLHRAGVPVVSVAPIDVEGALLTLRAAGGGLLRSSAMPGHVRSTGRSMLESIAARWALSCQEHLRRSGADLVHVVGQDAGAAVLIGAAHAAGLAVLFQDLGAGTEPSVFDGLTSNLALCSEVAALSPQIAARVADVLGFRGRVSVLPIMAEPAEEAATAAPSPAAATVFGFAGRLDPAKGSLVMVEAFARARATRPGIRLRVSGNGSEARPLLARERALGVADACEHPRTYTDPAGRSVFMRSIDVLLLPSDTEGTPNCIVESMAHGLPVIATSVGGVPDIVAPEVGVLVPPRRVDALAHAIGSLADDPARRARMGIAAVKRYERLFSPSAVLPLLVETYGRVADASNVSAVPVRHDWAACGDGRQQGHRSGSAPPHASAQTYSRWTSTTS